MEENNKKTSEKIENINKNSILLKIIAVIAILVIIFLIANVIVKNATGESIIEKIFNSGEKPNNTNSIQIVDPIYPSYNGNNEPADLKPIIYLYPTETTNVKVELGNPDKLSCTYPKYKEEWNVIAKPNGELQDVETGRNLYALYWEGKNIQKNTDMIEGFCLRGEDTAEFLEEKLKILGLTDREAEEFIIFWLPKMEKNEYNYIRFETVEEQNEAMPLKITPAPDTTIRIMMDWKALEEKIDVQEQKLEAPSRTGFVAVEWGGSELTD